MAGATAPTTATPTTNVNVPTSFNSIDDLNKFASQNWNNLSADQQNALHTTKQNMAAQQGYKVDDSGSLINSSGVNVGRTIPTGTPQTGTTGTTATAQTGTTGDYAPISTSLASQMMDAINNPQNTTQEYARINGEKVPEYNGRAFTTLQDIAQQTGIQYKKDPITGAITINGNTINPTGYDRNGNPIVYVRQFLTAAGVPDENVQYDQKTRNISYTAPQQQQQDQSMYQSPLSSLLSGMPQAPQIQPYQAPDLSGYYANLMPVQQQFNPDWNGYYNQAQNVYNPLAQNQINTLMNKQGMDINKADEGLNAKGIFNSGIAVQMENQIRANTNDQVAKVLMTAQSNMAKYAQQLYNDAYTQWNQGNANALKNNQMWLTQAMDQQKQSFQQWLDTQNLNETQYKNALTAWDNVANLAMKDAQFQATQQLDYAKLAQQDYQFSHLSANQLASQSGYLPNGQPTLTNTNDTRTYYDNLSKTLGYMIGPDGSLMLDNNGKPIPTQQASNQAQTLAEKIRSDQANEVMKATQLMGYDPSGKPTLDMMKYNEMVQTDQAKAQEALQTASNNQDRTLITKYQAQIASINDDIKNYISSHDMTQKANQDAVDQMVAKKNAILTNIDQIGNASSNYGSGPFTTDQLTSIATKAAVKAGVPVSWVGPLVQIAMHESSGNPNAVNPQGIDPKTGGAGNEHATGLMQTLPSTFQEYSNGNINDPVDNMVAAIGYIRSRYGDPNVALQKSLNGGY